MRSAFEISNKKQQQKDYKKYTSGVMGAARGAIY